MGFGRIEILTKPGTDTLHGRVAVQGNDSSFNTGSPYVAAGNQEPYHSVNYEYNLSGSLHHVASLSFVGFQRNIDDSAIVNAIVLDPSFNPVSFNAGVDTPQQLTNLSPRIDYQLTRNNTFTARYQYTRNIRENVAVGAFALPSQADNAHTTEHLLQLIDSQIIGERAVNETRFQYIDNETGQSGQSSAPSLQVIGAFTGGGSSRSADLTDSNRYEFQNSTSLIVGPHIFKFGGRLRANHIVNSSTTNFSGTFTFPSLTAYQLTEQGLQQGLTPAQIRANGGGASQFSIAAGIPQVVVNTVDLGVYVQDDWKLRPNLTLSAGFRFETENNIPDHVDPAPRFGLAWSVGKKARPTVFRGGYGIFYIRFPDQNVQQLARFNGVNQQQYFVTNPDFFPVIPAISTLTAAQALPTVYSISPDCRSGYWQQWAFTVERQLNRVANLSLNYIGQRAVHRIIITDINAPFPGSITAANPAGTRPFPNQGNIYQYVSESDYKGNFAYAQLNVRAGAALSFFTYYGLGWGHANPVGALGGFTSNPYNFNQDWGRAIPDIHHSLFFSGTFALPRGFRLSPFGIVQTGGDFNITDGQDLNGDGVFNDRPGFVTPQTLPQNIVVTPYGNFDKAPAPGNVIPINYGQGPARATLNLRVSRTFNLSKAPSNAAPAGAPLPGMPAPTTTAGFGPRIYTLTFNIDARNIFNKVNRGNPVGNLSSPLFGQINSLAGGPFTTGAAVRRLDLQLVFAF